MYDSEIKTIIDYFRSNHPLFYIQHSDYFAFREIIQELQKKINNQQNLKKKKLENENKDTSGIKKFEFLEYSESLGVTNLTDFSRDSERKEDLKSFLEVDI